jgi:hypothetical protein
MSVAEQQYRAHIERQRRLGKRPPGPVPTPAPPAEVQAPALAPRPEPPLDRSGQGRIIEELRQEIAQLSGRLKAMVREDQAPLVVPSRLKQVISAVANRYGVQLRDLVSDRRPRNVIRARQVAMYLAKELTGHSLPSIGRALLRDHTTVLHGCRQIAKLRLQDPKLDAQIRDLTALLASKEDVHE